jgi:hypothetical protein
MITELNEINNQSEEGRLLLAAIAKITTESQTDKTPDQVLNQLNDLSLKMHGGEQELVQCECGKEVPVDSAFMDGEGLWNCPDCVRDRHEDEEMLPASSDVSSPPEQPQ